MIDLRRRTSRRGGQAGLRPLGQIEHHHSPVLRRMAPRKQGGVAIHAFVGHALVASNVGVAARTSQAAKTASLASSLRVPGVPATTR